MERKLKIKNTKRVYEYWRGNFARIFIEIYDDSPNECVFTYLWVDEGLRNKGYGKQVLSEAELIAKEKGCTIAFLKVEFNSWMHKWYLRCGYKWYKNAPDNYTWLTKNLNDMEKKKKEYPKTYCECKDILGLWDIDDTERGYYKTDLIDKFQMLLICRDAYWKIAGDEIGLGKSWEPDWKKQDKKYIISVFEGTVIYFENETYNSNTLLAFPTEEMRDAFYENFKEEIEMCKELL